MTDDLTPLKGSSRLEAMGYDADTRILKIRFPSGAVYQYMDVPLDAHKQLLAESENPRGSVGKLFHALVVKGGFGYEKL